MDLVNSILRFNSGTEDQTAAGKGWWIWSILFSVLNVRGAEKGAKGEHQESHTKGADDAQSDEENNVK